MNTFAAICGDLTLIAVLSSNASTKTVLNVRVGSPILSDVAQFAHRSCLIHLSDEIMPCGSEARCRKHSRISDEKEVSHGYEEVEEEEDVEVTFRREPRIGAARRLGRHSGRLLKSDRCFFMRCALARSGGMLCARLS